DSILNTFFVVSRSIMLSDRSSVLFFCVEIHKLSVVKKFCDSTLVKIQENLINILSKNKLGSDNKRLKGRDWSDYDVKSSREMLKKIDETLRHREQLGRLAECIGGRRKTVNPCTFVRPL
nr:hypothetical protein [Tanacetum cinerariifolium]